MSEIDEQTGVVASTTDRADTGVQAKGRLDVVAGDRRDRTLTYLAERGTPVSLDALVVAIAASEAETPPVDLDEPATKRVAISLHHVHLPKLLQEGYVHVEDDGLTLAVEESALDAL